MDEGPNLARRRVQLVNSYGLALRAGDKFVRLAQSFKSAVRVVHQGMEVNGKSILDLMLLAAECGSFLDLEARGPDAEEVLDALAELIATGFDRFEEEDLPQPPEGPQP
jgi:phosphocarrier protein